ncbi:MAG: ATP-binding cassette domain-containing protein [Candidatus Cloacimonetes bacterium]|nr:ATP-binding cassette domain-containing protein [Candidatus Cloacimonadota bacterium]
MIRLEQLSFCYENKPPLFTELNLHIKPNQNVLLSGENGCGKSTLLKLIMGILSPQSGSVFLAEKPVQKLHAGLFQHIFYQSQNTVDNLLGISQQQDWQLWQIAIPALPDYPDNSDKLFSERSTGEQKQDAQRILPYLSSKFWVLDEPFASLDSSASERLFQLLSLKMKEQPGMLIVAHELAGCESYFDKVLELKNGNIIEFHHA